MGGGIGFLSKIPWRGEGVSRRGRDREGGCAELGNSGEGAKYIFYNLIVRN